MSVEVRVKLVPFPVPDDVGIILPVSPREKGLQQSPRYQLKDLDRLTLEGLCAEFRASIFEKAGVDPTGRDEFDQTFD